MNALDILKYGHQTFVSTLDAVPDQEWSQSGVCGIWSVKDIVVHLASCELILADVLRGFVDGGPTPHLDRFRHAPDQFNDMEVIQRQDKSAQDVLSEYHSAHAEVMALAPHIAQETYRQVGTLPWYGSEYALDDLIVYMSYGHKREHSAQIAAFLDTLENNDRHFVIQDLELR